MVLEYTPGRGEAKQFAYLAGKQIAMRRLFGSSLDLDRDGTADAIEINQRPGAVTAGEDLTYYHPDAMGSSVASTTHPAGLLSWKESYKPYGERQVKSVLAGINNTRFAGKPEDEESGLAYFGARYYDPILGRFMGLDPVAPNPENIHSFNRYAYANNSPYKYVDPDGRLPIFIPIAAALLFEGGNLALESASDASNPCGDCVRSSGVLIPSGPVTVAGYKLGKMLSQPVVRAETEVAKSADNLADYAHNYQRSVGASQRVPQVLQSGGNKLSNRVSDGLNDCFGENLTKQDWGRALEGLKKDMGLRNDHHGRTLDNGDYINDAGDRLGNIADYLP